jgi:hypothetical protein
MGPCRRCSPFPEIISLLVCPRNDVLDLSLGPPRPDKKIFPEAERAGLSLQSSICPIPGYDAFPIVTASQLFLAYKVAGCSTRHSILPIFFS